MQSSLSSSTTSSPSSVLLFLPIHIILFAFRLTKRLATLNIDSPSCVCTPESSGISKQVNEWKPGQWLAQDISTACSQEEDRQEVEHVDARSLLPIYNEAMAVLSKNSKSGQVTPLDFQLKTTWNKATQNEKDICIDKAIEGCKVVCSVVALNAGEELLQSFTQPSKTEHV